MVGFLLRSVRLLTVLLRLRFLRVLCGLLLFSRRSFLLSVLR